MPALALADPAPTGEGHSHEALREELLAQAMKALRQNHLREANAAWRAAYELRPEYWLACNIGKAEFKYGSTSEAANYLGKCLTTAPANPEPEERPKLEQYAEDFKKAREQSGLLSVVVNVKGADITIGARRFGTSPLAETFVAPGEYVISVQRPGYEPKDVTVTLAKGEARSVAIDLEKSKRVVKSAPPAPPPIALPVASSSGRSPALIVAGASVAVTAAGLGALFMATASSAAEQVNLSRSVIRGTDATDCTATSTEPICRIYFMAGEQRQALTDYATASFIAAGISTAATLVYTLYPRSPIKPSRHTAGSFVIAEW